jgi:hypothetical protein
VSGRSGSFIVALFVVIGAGSVTRGAPPPTARAVRVDDAGDERLAGLAAAVRAELAAAGFKVAPEMTGAGSGAAAWTPAVITLRVDGARALVVATAEGAASSFSAEVAIVGAGAVRRDVNRVALQVAEWLAAIWLPAPPVRAAAAPALAGAPASASSPQPMVEAPPAAAGPEPVAPPVFVAAPAAPATVRQVPDSPPAAPRTLDFDLAFGGAVLHAPDFRTQSGFELGVALHGRSPIVRTATPFARLLLGAYWLGTSHSLFDLNFANIAASAGLRLPLVEKISVEANAGVGLMLVWVGVQPAASGYSISPSDRTWVATPGGALALVTHLSPRLALAAEVRASWMVPRLVFVTSAALVGDSDGPMITGALALRITL